MSWGNAVLSENQNDVEAYVTERGCVAEIFTSREQNPFPEFVLNAAFRGPQAMKGKTEGRP